MLIYIFLIFISFSISSSDLTPGPILSGKVTDSDQNPIAYSHVGIIGIPTGTITDESGKFDLDISKLTEKDSLFISAIVYKTQKYGFNELSPEKEIFMILEKETYSQNEIQVTARKRNSIHFGRDKSGGNSGWMYSRIATGSEAGMVFSNNKNVLLSAFKFQIKATDFDSLMYRIHVYESSNDKLIPLNKTEIRKTSSIKTGWINVELEDYRLTTNLDFAFTVEILKGWKDGKSTSQGNIKFPGRNALSKQMLQRSHQFMEAEMIGLKLNMAVIAYQ